MPVPAQGINPNLAMFAQMAGQPSMQAQQPQQSQMTPQMMMAMQQMMQQRGQQAGQQGMPQPPQGGMPAPQGPQGAPPPQMPQGAPQGRPQMPMPQGAPQGMPQGAQPGMAPQGLPPQPTQTPQGQQIPPGMDPRLIQQLMQSQPAPQQLSPRLNPAGSSGQPAYTPQEMAALGRMGDSTIAHLTPGEMTVPPELQSPKVLATLNQAYKGAGVNPQQFTAGSSQQSINPNTGAPEFSLWSHLLPIGLGLAGAAFAPELLPAIGFGGSSALAAGIGGGLGTAAGGLASGQSAQQALLGGAAAGLGGYAGGQIFGAPGEAASASAGSAGGNAGSTLAADPNSVSGEMLKGLGGAPSWGILDPSKLSSLGDSAGSTAAGSSGMGSIPTPSLMNLYGALNKTNINPGALAGSALGGELGSYFGKPAATVTPQTTNNSLTSGSFNQPYTQPTASWQDLIGQNTSQSPRANFNGYNAANGQQATGWNFFPTNGQAAITPPAAATM